MKEWAVVLHASGRVDAERVGDLAARTRLIYRSAMAPPMYSLLELCDAQVEAQELAAKVRVERKKAKEAMRAVGDHEEGLV